MPVEYEIRDDSIWFRSAGEFAHESGVDAMVNAVREVRGRAEARPLPVVFDIQGSRETRNADELRAIAGFVSRNADVFAPRCAVIAGDDLHYGLARMFEAFADSHGVAVSVLRSQDDVPGWLASTKRPDA